MSPRTLTRLPSGEKKLFSWTTLKKAQNGNEGLNRFNSPEWIIHRSRPIVNPRQIMDKDCICQMILIHPLVRFGLSFPYMIGNTTSLSLIHLDGVTQRWYSVPRGLNIGVNIVNDRSGIPPHNLWCCTAPRHWSTTWNLSLLCGIVIKARCDRTVIEPNAERGIWIRSGEMQQKY